MLVSKVVDETEVLGLVVKAKFEVSISGLAVADESNALRPVSEAVAAFSFEVVVNTSSLVLVTLVMIPSLEVAMGVSFTGVSSASSCVRSNGSSQDSLAVIDGASSSIW